MSSLVTQTLPCASGKKNRENLEVEWFCYKVNDNSKGFISTCVMMGMQKGPTPVCPVDFIQIVK